MVCPEFPVASKFHFSQWKINFSQFIFIDKHLKSKEIEYFIHCIKFEMRLVLLYVKSFFLSTVELKLRHSLFKFILRFKLEIFWFISLNLYAGGPQKTHQSYHQAPLDEFHETFYYAFSTKEIIFKSKNERKR